MTDKKAERLPETKDFRDFFRVDKAALLSEIVSILTTLLALAISLIVTTFPSQLSKSTSENTFHAVSLSLDRLIPVFVAALVSFAALLVSASYIVRQSRRTSSGALDLKKQMTQIYLSALDASPINPENSERFIWVADDSSAPGRYKKKI